MRCATALSIVFLALTSHAMADTQEYTVQQTLVDDHKAVIATVQSVREVQARARINGTITLLNVKEGDHVEAGDKIAIIGDAKLAIRGQGLSANIQAAQSAYDKAKLDFSRASELRQSGYGTQARLDETRANMQIAENNLAAARAAQGEVTQQTSEGAVVAPSAGRILKVPVSQGGVVMSGEIVAVMAPENYILRAELPERHARHLKVGDTVLVGTRGLKSGVSEEYKTGKVQLVYPEIKDGRVVADITASDLGDYFVGERTRMLVSTGERPAFLIPNEMLTRRFGVSLVKLKGGQEVVVQAGRAMEDKTEILSGLKSGDVVVLP